MSTTTTIQHNPISLQDDEDIALSNYLTKSFQPQEVWMQPKQPYVTNNHYYKQQRRTRTSSGPIQIQKSTSTPIPSNNRSRSNQLRNQQPVDTRRRSNLNTMQERRPSLASSIASSSIDSDISTASKASFSNRLRKVFSMSNIRSSKDSLDESNCSVVSTESSSKKSLRRRSIASLSNLFQKSSIQEETSEVQEKKKPELKVDVQQQRKKGRSKHNTNLTPDSPNSTISSRSFTKLPPPVNTNQRFIHHSEALPSPTPSSSSSSTRPSDLQKPNPIGLQYGIGLHASPKLKPTTSSSSSLTCHNDKRRIQFCSTVQVHETFAANEYDRRCDSNATCQKLTLVLAMKIKQELNEYKLSDMEVHVESRQYTQFFL